MLFYIILKHQMMYGKTFRHIIFWHLFFLNYYLGRCYASVSYRQMLCLADVVCHMRYGRCYHHRGRCYILLLFISGRCYCHMMLWKMLYHITVCCNVKNITSLLEFCLNSTYFTFQARYFEQQEGAAMGSPISPIVANLYMEEFEIKAINSAWQPPPILE